jgi:hypothetical protein
VFQFLQSLFAPSAPAPSTPAATPKLAVTTLEGRDCPAVYGSYSWVLLNPQPLPPKTVYVSPPSYGGWVSLNPQPLPPRYWWG